MIFSFPWIFPVLSLFQKNSPKMFSEANFSRGDFDGRNPCGNAMKEFPLGKQIPCSEESHPGFFLKWLFKEFLSQDLKGKIPLFYFLVGLKWDFDGISRNFSGI